MWLKIDDKFTTHAKVVGLSDSALALWVKCAVWSARHETDGHVPDGVIRTQAPARTIRQSRQLLIRAGLWTECDDGIDIHDFTEWNPSKAKLDDQRADAAERQRRRRARDAGVEPG